MHLLKILKKNAKSKKGKKIFIVFEGKKYSFYDVNNLVNQTCNYFLSLGLKLNHSISIYFDNSITFVLLYLSSMRFGLIVNPYPSYLPKKDFISNSKNIKTKITFSQDLVEINNNIVFKNDNEFIKTIRKFNKKFKEKKININNTAVMYYSSGSTGAPKLIEISHKAISNSQILQKNSPLMKSGDRHLCILPLAHTSSLRSTLKFCLYNCRTVYLFKNFWLIKNKIIKIIEKYKITFIQTVPSILSILCELFKNEKKLSFKVKSLKFVASGSAYLSEKIESKFKNLFNIPIINIYGLSETCAISMTSLNKNKYIDNSLGKVLKGIKFKIINEKNKESQDGSPGELYVKTPAIFKQYFFNKKKIKNFTKNNYFKTGDVVTKDMNGNLFFIERKKNIVIKSGININCREIDDAIMSLKYIKDSFTTSKEDEFHGEIPISYVVFKDKKIKKTIILKALNEILGNFKLPSEIIVLKKMPRTSTGKILYSFLPK